MRNTTSAFKRALAEDRRDYVCKAAITLADGTSITHTTTKYLPDGTEEVVTYPYVDNSGIWDGGFDVDDAVSGDNSFDVGAAIINKSTIILNNIYGEFEAYDFQDAEIVPSVGLEALDNGEDEYIKMGTFTVDDVTYNGSIITLSCFDNMAKFDKPYSQSTIIYSNETTLRDIVDDACTRCGVTLATNSYQFPNYNFVVATPPTTEGTTFRQVLSWVAQIAGCFARCNADGELEIKFYDFDAISADTTTDLDGGEFDDGTPSYSTGDAADGGTFNPWNTTPTYDGGTFLGARNYHVIPASYSYKVSTDDVVITGVSVRIKTEGADSASSYAEYTYGVSGYVVSVENNELITAETAQTVANYLGNRLVGRRFRKANITHPSDPSIEAGDVGYFYDYKGNKYDIIVSSTNFSARSSQTTNSSAETPRKNSATVYTEATKNYVEIRKRIRQQQTAWENATSELSRRLDAAGGLYETYTTNVHTGEGLIRHYHDKPELSESNIVMMFTDVGFTLTSNYQDEDPTWYGMTVDGQLISSILNTVGVNADWIKTGSILIKDAYNNETFYANTATGDVRIKAQSLSVTGASLTSSWSGDGIPTNSNYPAVDWDTTLLQQGHEGDMYYDNLGSGIYKYSQMHRGFLVKFTGTFSYAGSEGFVIAFRYNNKWYKYVDPFTSTNVDQSFFIPTDYTYPYSSSRYSAFLVKTAAGATCSLTYTVSLADDVFPNAEEHGATSPVSSGFNLKRVDLNTAYTNIGSVPTADTPYTIMVNTTIIDPSTFYDWKSIGVSGEDTYARSAITTLDSSLNDVGILNRLTDNGAIQGVWSQDGKFYLNFASARGGTLFLGGVNNGYGLLRLYNNSGELTSEINKEHAIFADANTGYHVKLREGRMVIGVDESLWPPYSGSSYSVASIGMNDISDEIAGGSMPSWHTSSDETVVFEQESSSKSIIIRGNSAVNSRRTGIEVDSHTIYMNGSVYIQGNYWVTEAKGRIVENTKYGTPSLYCYETPTPYFGDIGTGQTDENGEAIIAIDDIFDETVNTNIEYCVFLQKEGQGDLWVDEKDHSYFIVKGTPNLKFSWEIKAVQKGFEELRLDDDNLRREDYVPVDDIDKYLDAELAAYDKEMEELYQ